MHMKFTMIAPCLFGLETFVAGELREMGAQNIRSENGRVFFDGEEFMLAFVRNFPITLHIKQLAGANGHHIIEGMFKALRRVLKEALSINQENPDEIPSTKGVL